MGKSKQPRNKIGRNAPCPCGSGKKYKKCHGRSHGVVDFESLNSPMPTL